MPLYVVRHHHEASRCPARHPAMGAMLLTHLGPESATAHGVTVHAKVMVDGEHTLCMIVDAADPAVVQQFMAPFGQLGEVMIQPATSCEEVVARGFD